MINLMLLCGRGATSSRGLVSSSFIQRQFFCISLLNLLVWPFLVKKIVATVLLIDK